MWLAMRMLCILGALAIGASAAVASLPWLGLEAQRDLRPVPREAGSLQHPMIEARFNVFLADGALTYVREPCDAADAVPVFFLHVFPWEASDLPLEHIERGFERNHFDIMESGSLSGGVCKIRLPLPDYPIKHIATGQVDGTRELWSGSFDVPQPDAIVERSDAVFAPGEVVTLSTHLHALDVSTIRLEPFAIPIGGAIERVGEDLLVVTPRGRLAVIGANGQAHYLEARVPMNEPNLMGQDPASANHRVLDILARQRAPDHYDLFATHQFLREDCLLFRLSATTLRVVEGSLEVSPTWRAVFDAKPCLAGMGGGTHAGGRLLADGPHHLLVTVGCHFCREQHGVKYSEHHYGKVLRVDPATGEATALTAGHKNPLGIARDGYGNLWLTEHGARGGDELNLLEPGGHYGYPKVSYGYQYRGWTLNANDRVPGTHDDFLMPRFAWVPSIGISAIVVNDATAFPLWGDDLLVGSMRGAAISGRRWKGLSLFRVRRTGTQVRYVERIELGDRIRDVSHASDALAVLTDSARVLLLRRSDRARV